ncbi:MAG: HEAT repeat domain-containing protein [Candidatus Eisenbacteria bacterium]
MYLSERLRSFPASASHSARTGPATSFCLARRVFVVPVLGLATLVGLTVLVTLASLPFAERARAASPDVPSPEEVTLEAGHRPSPPLRSTEPMVRGLPRVALGYHIGAYEPLDPDPEEKARQWAERTSDPVELLAAAADAEARSTALIRLARLLNGNEEFREDIRTRAFETTLEALADSSGSVRVTAAYALGFYGPDALPHLRPLLDSQERNIALAATIGLGRVGATTPGAADAIAELLERELVAMPEPSRRNDALSDPRRPLAWALGGLGTAAVPVIERALTSARPEVREVAIRAASRLGENAVPLLPLLVRVLEEPAGNRSEGSRGKLGSAAAWAIASTGEAGIGTLIERLDEVHPENAEVTLHVLQRVAGDDPRFRAAVRRVLREGPGELRPPFLYVLLWLEPASSCDYFVDMVEEQNQGFDLLHLATQLDSCNADLTPIADELVTMLDAKGWTQRLAAVVALRHTSGDPDEITRAVLPLVQDPNTFVEREAVTTLGILGRSSELAITELMTLLDDEKRDDEAALALGLAGPSAVRAVPKLVGWVETCRDAKSPSKSDESRAARAGQALATIDPALAADLYTPDLTSDDARRQSAAVRVLSSLESRDDSVIPALTRLLTSDDRVSMTAAGLLIRMGPDHPAARAAVIEGLGTERRETRGNLMAAVSKAADRESWVVPELITGLGHENPSVRATCAILLERVGVSAADIVGPLKRATEDPDENVRWYARLALETLER